jgi:CubicO group peptidase (beta-lactamase class C family)
MSISKRQAVSMRLDGVMTTPARSGDLERIASLLQAIAGDSCRQAFTGIAIGVLADGQEFSAVTGWADVDSKRPVSHSTVFELGSLSSGFALFTSMGFVNADPSFRALDPLAP